MTSRCRRCWWNYTLHRLTFGLVKLRFILPCGYCIEQRYRHERERR